MTAIRVRGNIHYALAVLILAVSAGLMQAAKSYGWLIVIKKALLIRKPLTDMDRGCLAPFEYVGLQRLPPEVEGELGTEEYLNWIIDLPALDKPWRGRCFLSVTYFTGKQDRLPHVAEECMHQSGYAKERDDELTMELAGIGETIPVRRLRFAPRRQTGSRMYVYYVICVNHDFYAGRTGARIRMANDEETHLYHCKVEISFQGVDDTKLGEVDERAQDVFDKAIAELVRSHWPLRGWEKGGPPVE